ncbi:type VI secretion system baseplate subunit TssF, partial [Vibrio rotiferianus]
ETKALVDSLVHLEYEKTTGRISAGGKVGFAHGIRITLMISDQILPPEQIFLLGSVLSIYFSQYAEVNIFTQLEVKLKSTSKRFHLWPAMTGEKPLL